MASIPQLGPWHTLIFHVSSEVGVTPGDILSNTPRAVVFCGTTQHTDKQYALRVSDLLGCAESCDAIVRFCATFAGVDSEMSGIVPMRRPQTFGHEGRQYLLEMYARIVYRNDCSLDLFQFLGKLQDQRLRILWYLHDTIESIGIMHEAGFCHLDISLENIVLSPTRAYLIDFESNMQFATGNDEHFIPRWSVTVPVKRPYCPIEHFLASATDYVLMENYDIWAWGVACFSTLFGADLFDHTSTSHEDGVVYFSRHGFSKFVEKHHPTIYDDVLQSRDLILTSAWDLLAKLFVVSKPKVFDFPESGKNTLWCAHDRLTADDILKHSLWDKLEMQISDAKVEKELQEFSNDNKTIPSEAQDRVASKRSYLKNSLKFLKQMETLFTKQTKLVKTLEVDYGINANIFLRDGIVPRLDISSSTQDMIAYAKRLFHSVSQLADLRETALPLPTLPIPSVATNKSPICPILFSRSPPKGAPIAREEVNSKTALTNCSVAVPKKLTDSECCRICTVTTGPSFPHKCTDSATRQKNQPDLPVGSLDAVFFAPNIACADQQHPNATKLTLMELARDALAIKMSDTRSTLKT